MKKKKNMLHYMLHYNTQSEGITTRQQRFNKLN